MFGAAAVTFGSVEALGAAVIGWLVTGISWLFTVPHLLGGSLSQQGGFTGFTWGFSSSFTVFLYLLASAWQQVFARSDLCKYSCPPERRWYNPPKQGNINRAAPKWTDARSSTNPSNFMEDSLLIEIIMENQMESTDKWTTKRPFSYRPMMSLNTMRKRYTGITLRSWCSSSAGSSEAVVWIWGRLGVLQ